METSLSSGIEGGQDPKVDDDGHPKRTGTLITTTAHIITAVIGSGVLSLAWATAQLGWIAGPATLLAFALISCYAASLLADCYRSPDGKRNQTYMEVVRAHLGGHNVKICGIAQFSNLIGTTIGYTITTSLSLMAIEKSNCYHKNGHDANCRQKNMSFTILYGMAQILLSQIPNFHELAFLSIFAALMSFTYSSIALGLSIDRIARYAAFGNDAPSNFLTTFGFYDPFWLIDFANACIVVHLLGAYQVFAQPVFAFVEKRCENRWPDSRFINGKSFKISANKTWNVSMFKLTWRTAYVALTTIVAMLFPFFNDFVGLLGAISYWPLTIYLPFQMYIKRTNIRRLSFTWIWLTVLCVACLLLSILAAAGSIRGLIKAVRRFEPFQAES
nr:Amino acid transporter, transmembrane [Ipomoea batatas]